ncbi:sigma-54 interaction domain-containing protein [Thauera sp. SDU_THAU2]|uniref:sigma-54 interaction domain-containing protein n=1 Tax=Thauera sp. SDU_THAU2 TaxID=3136633 RepID=UPI00311D8D9F
MRTASKNDWFGSGQDEAEFLRQVLDHVSECLVAVDTAGRIVFINTPYCRLLGGSAESFLGRHISDVVSPESRLHKVAQGSDVVVGAVLEVRGHKLITRQVPVFQDGRIIGAVGMALFSNVDLLKQTFALASRPGQAIQHSRNAWAARASLDDLLGTGAQFENLCNRLRQVAAHSHPVLILGETGSGKDLAASAIHSLSARAKRPFVWMNCASIPETLIDAELFGYEGGAFTGARSQGKPGKFELANTGTLFLDEIGDMPLHLQGSLLRAIQNQEIVRVGGTAPQLVDVRIICATNRPLLELVKAGKFRADLFYRLNVLNIEMTALREREDLEFFIGALFDRLCRREGFSGRQLGDAEIKQLLSHSWPGNVRELEGVLLRLLISNEIRLPKLPDTESNETPADPEEGMLDLQSHMARERLRHIKRVIDSVAQDKDRAARLLGISRATLYRELQHGGR